MPIDIIITIPDEERDASLFIYGQLMATPSLTTYEVERHEYVAPEDLTPAQRIEALYGEVADLHEDLRKVAEAKPTLENWNAANCASDARNRLWSILAWFDRAEHSAEPGQDESYPDWVNQSVTLLERMHAEWEAEQATLNDPTYAPEDMPEIDSRWRDRSGEVCSVIALNYEDGIVSVRYEDGCEASLHVDQFIASVTALADDSPTQPTLPLDEPEPDPLPRERMNRAQLRTYAAQTAEQVWCPYCGAKVGNQCTTAVGNKAPYSHQRRIKVRFSELLDGAR